MIKHWGKLALIHLGIFSIFEYILLFGDVNMFTFALTTVFFMSTTYCAFQWYVNRTIAKLEAKHGK